ncbi:MAG: hypothetical protein L0Y72_11025 [Gemmataceae bacterium]|nr:hypothetical protein [Gemmataceae bacterium]
MPALHNRLLPTDAWVRLALVPILIFVAQASDRSYLADFWHHLARGREIAQDGRLLDHDVFTFTVSGQEFQDVNWLSQVIYFRLFEIGGLGLVQVVNALFLAGTFALLIGLCWRLSGALPAALAGGLVAFLGMWQVLTLRPQTFSLFLFVLLWIVLEKARSKPVWLLVPPVLLALWANLHGAFPAGLILVGGYWAAELFSYMSNRTGTESYPTGDKAYFWQLTACLAACVLATLANPYGWHIYQYVGLTSNRATQRRIDEWLPPSLDEWIGIAFFLSLPLVAGLVYVAWKRGMYRPNWRDVIFGAVFLFLAARSVRMVAWWLFFIAPLVSILLARLLPKLADKPEQHEPNRGAAWSFAALTLIAVTALPGLQRYNPLFALRPQERVEGDLEALEAHLRTHVPQGRVFSRFEWGEYLSWSAWPDYKVFMDGRIEIYPDPVWQEYADITLGKERWQRILEQYRVDALILDEDYHAQTGLLPLVLRSPHWQRVAQSRNALLFVRSDRVATK